MSFFFFRTERVFRDFESLSFYHCLSVGKSKANQGWTPLHLASYFGHCNVAKALLEVSGKLMLLYLFARCSFLFEALLGKGRGEVEGGRGGGGGKGRGEGEGEGGRGREGGVQVLQLHGLTCHGLSLITVMSSEEEYAHSSDMEYRPMADHPPLC